MSDEAPLSPVRDLSTDSLRVRLDPRGAMIAAVQTPDRNGTFGDVCLRLDDAVSLGNGSNFGATVGRFANRIGGGTFVLDGQTYTLEQNNGPNNLHSAPANLGQRPWSELGHDLASVAYEIATADGEAGFPGTLTCRCTYTVDGNELRIDYEARVSDRPTIVNLTNHAYWNLTDAVNPPLVHEHAVQIEADSVLVPDESVCPTGEIVPVAGTAFDFREPRSLGETWEDQPGYDHCFVLRGGETAEPRLAAVATSAASGRTMTVLTTQPGVQFYMANHFGGEAENGGFDRFRGFCFEAQRFPDGPNHAHFPSCRLDPGDVYRQTTIHRFTVES